MDRVKDMWEYTHATLLDVQPILMEALGDRGISELELERARDRSGAGRKGRGVLVGCWLRIERACFFVELWLPAASPPAAF